MSESRPAIALLAWVISDPALELHRFVFENGLELGRAGGDVLWWYPIGNPRSVDPIYLELRSPELAARDEVEAAQYEAACRAAGGEDHYLRGQYEQRSIHHEVPLAERPLIIFKSDPPVGTAAKLHFDCRVFGSTPWRFALAQLLCHELSTARLGRLRERGAFTEASMMRLQYRLNDLRCRIRNALDGDDAGKLLPAPASPITAPSEKDPELQCHAKFTRRADDALVLSVRNNGDPAREVVFEPQGGRPSKQLQVMRLLCHRWPKPVSFRDGITAAYGDDWASRSGNNKEDVVAVADKFRALLSDIRKKLEKHGIDPDIVPSGNPFKHTSGGLWLRLASLNGRSTDTGNAK